MTIIFKAYQSENIPLMTQLWNNVIKEGTAFPGEETFTTADFQQFLSEQTAVTCIFYDNVLTGFGIIHPNNIGHCRHIANASYLINPKFRGKGIFSKLVSQSLEDAKKAGFRGMQFNAVVVSNLPAFHTYIKNGFEVIGTIRDGFQLKNDTYTDIFIMYRSLVD